MTNNKYKGQINMKIYNINDIFNYANNIYNLKITSQNDKLAVERAIRRELKKLTLPTEINEDQLNFLVNRQMKKYFMKKSKSVNPFLDQDKHEFDAVNTGKKKILTKNDAKINAKLDFIISYITNDKITFSNDKFNKAYNNYSSHIDTSGLPLPGYTEAKLELENYKNFFKDKNK